MHNHCQYSPLLFSTDARLECADNEYACKLLDLSLYGALISKCDASEESTHKEAKLTFALPPSNIKIQLDVVFCHIEQDYIGLKCSYVDIDNITYLKQLIELNLADDDLLHRELDILIHEIQQ